MVVGECARPHQLTFVNPGPAGRRREEATTAVLNTIRRAGTLLTLFTEERPDWGVREVAAALGMPRSNAHELMSSLASIGLLQRTPDSRYRLGWRLLTLSGHLVNSTDVARVGSSVLSQLANQHRQTVSIATYDNGQMVSIGQAEPRGSAPVSRIGDRLPAHSTASGKIMLANLGIDPASDEIELERFTPHTMTDPDQLRRALTIVRRNDIAFDRQETDEAIVCVGSPIRDGRTGGVVAALTLCVSPGEFERGFDVYTRSVLRAARQVSSLLGTEAHAELTNSVARLAHRSRFTARERGADGAASAS
jgi:IclR family transcriptional regulator, KDG regulon repressor